MGIFSRKPALTDPFILSFSKNDSQMIKSNEEIRQALLSVFADRQGKQDVIKQLPEMQLKVASRFFKALRQLAVAQGTSFTFEQIDVLTRTDKYQVFIHVTDLTIDRQFRDFTGAVVTTLFTSPEIKQASYNERQGWAAEFIDAYQNANPEQAIIALVPTETESETVDFKVRYAGLDVAEAEASSQATQADSDETQPATSQATPVTENASASSGQTIKPEAAPAAQPTTAPVVVQTHQGDEATPKPTKAAPAPVGSRAAAKRPVKVQAERLNDGGITAPQFKVKPLKPVSATDEQYVAYQCGVKKQHSNTYLQTLAQRVNATAKQTLTQLREQQRQAIKQAVQEYQQNNDPSQGLAAEIKQTISQERQAAIEQATKDLTASRDRDIEQIRADTERAIKQRTVECEHQLAEQKDTITQTFTKKANELSEKRLKERQAKLQAHLAEYTRDLEKQAKAAYNEMVGQVIAENQNVVGTVYQRLAKAIDEYALEVTKVHLNAVEVKASADRAKFNLKDVERLEAQTAQLKTQTQQLAQEKTNLQSLLDRQSQELNQLKTQPLPATDHEQASKLDQLIALQLANVQSRPTPVTDDTTAAKAAKPAKSSVATRVATGLGALLALVTLGGGGLWAYQNNQQVNQALSSTQSQLARTQQATAAMDKRYANLSSTNHDLRGEVKKNKHALSQAQANSQSTAAKLKQAQAQSQATTATSSANKTSDKSK